MEHFQHDLDWHLTRRDSADGDNERVTSELCEERLDLSSSPRAPTLEQGSSAGSAPCTDRADLIERLKRGESPTWIPPNRHFKSVIWNKPEQPVASASRSPTHGDDPGATSLATLLPPPSINAEKDWSTSDNERRHLDVLKIERPRSALHSGDFTHDEASPGAGRLQHGAFAGTPQESNNRSQALITTSGLRNLTPLQIDRGQSLHVRSNEVRSTLSSLSSPVSTSFLFMPPTSPLFQSESNDDVELASPFDRIDLSSSHSRRHSQHMIMPSIPDSYGSSQGLQQKYGSPIRQERAFFQAHQPRRSITSLSTFSTSGHSPHTPAFLYARRPSIPTDTSPMQHASMIGSYEESILHGRMSTTPSKPLNFLAQIGVLGLGKCKASLRCPPHVTLPFPAVFYSYPSTPLGRSKGEDGPSPYVGQIDLENGLPSQEGQEEDDKLKKKPKSMTVERRMAETDAMDTDQAEPRTVSCNTGKPQRAKRRSGSPRAPQGGYRIPEKGQIQIIIKNPNKTAVKLFLVPYDLAGMEPGTKTFVRQRSYSHGPIIENAPSSNGNSLTDRPILRYLVHLHICCPSRGRFYLYKNIRVVFANRVPDGKEKLRNEITIPEPRFTPYKASKAVHAPSSSIMGPAASLAADGVLMRRSSTVYFDNRAGALGMADEPSPFGDSYPHSLARGTLQVEPGASGLLRNQMRTPLPDRNGVSRAYNSQSTELSRPATHNLSKMSLGNYAGQVDQYSKLNKGDVGYGGNAFSGLINGNPAVAESLLSQRLRSLAAPSIDPEESEDTPGPSRE